MSEHLQADEMWGQLVERYGWTDEDQVVKLKAKGIKNLIEQAWMEGNKIGREVTTLTEPEETTKDSWVNKMMKDMKDMKDREVDRGKEFLGNLYDKINKNKK